MKLNIGECFSFFIKEITLWKRNLVNSNANFLFLECSGFIFIKKPTFIIYFDHSYVFSSFLPLCVACSMRLPPGLVIKLAPSVVKAQSPVRETIN